MRILIGGASGLIGSALVAHLAAQGHQPLRLVRGHPARDDSEIEWDPGAGAIDGARLEGIEAVVNLSGATIARWPWTAGHKRRVLESRVRSTALLAQAVSGLKRAPRVFVSASGVGYYGDRGNEVVRETSPPGTDFLAKVCVAWEAAATPAALAGIRVVTPRIGMVLSGSGGALAALLIPFRLGLGGKIGNGRQYMSWISLEDLVAVIVGAVEGEDMRGPVNAVSPQPATNAEFTKTLARVIGRPTLLPLPKPAARLLLGAMADALLLSSARAEPTRLLESGFEFRFPALEDALRHAVAAGSNRQAATRRSLPGARSG